MNAITTANHRVRWEMGGIALLALLCNVSLLAGAPSQTLAFIPAEALSGSWWQWLTWPLVHVSGYHLMMDLTGFLSVFVLLGAMSCRRRWTLVAGAVAGSVALPLLLSSTVLTHGLAGLSGPAHGIMAAAALHYAIDARRQNDRPTFWLFAALFVGVLLKVAWELATGSVILSFAHFGDVGTPIVSTHLGGIIGALLVYGLYSLKLPVTGGRAQRGPPARWSETRLVHGNAPWRAALCAAKLRLEAAATWLRLPVAVPSKPAQGEGFGDATNSCQRKV